MKRFLDPHEGDIEDDWSSTKSRSLLSLAGSLVIEISLPKLVVAWLLLVAVPAVMLGLAPLLASVWIHRISASIRSPLTSIWPVLVLAVLITFGWFGSRTLFRMAENGFWALNSLAVQPAYVACREVLRHIVEAVLRKNATQAELARMRAVSAAVAGVILCSMAIVVLLLVWPSSRWAVDFVDLAAWRRLIWSALANSIVVASAYLAGASLIWALADATMAQPHDLQNFSAATGEGRIWRVAHLSDVHVVGERYGFRIESGRAGPRGNRRLQQAMDHLETLCAKNQLDVVLITGDMTDAGRSAEWAEFLDLLEAHPRLADRALVLPGNHDVNIVDRANPARMDTPASPKKRLRKLRVLSAMNTVQGRRVRVVDFEKHQLGESLAEAVEPYLADMAHFADAGRPRIFRKLAELWVRVFPMVLPPDRSDGLGIILLNSNADTHFSFTNALGMISTEQVRGIEIATAQYPQACWIIALHHHLVEYPRQGHALSDRIGTALINGNWFVRRLHPLADRAVVMHGHRHTDWIGECAGLPILSAPSPVMEAADNLETHFYIQSLRTGAGGQLRLLPPQRITVNAPSPVENRGTSAEPAA